MVQLILLTTSGKHSLMKQAGALSNLETEDMKLLSTL